MNKPGEPQAVPPAVPVPPKCPHCQSDLVSVDEYKWGLLVGISCPACHRLLHMQVMGVMVPQENEPRRPRVM